MAMIHLGCTNALAVCTERPPFDPDPHGNERLTHECTACGERGTLLIAPHGGMQSETCGFKSTRQVEWLVELDD